MWPELDDRLLRDSRDARPDPDPEAMRRGIADLLARGERAARRRRLVLAVAATVVLVAALVAVAADRGADRTPAGAAPSRLVDRTFACRTAGGMPTKVQSSPVKPVFAGPTTTRPMPAYIATGAGYFSGPWPFVIVRAAPWALAIQWGGPPAAGAFVDPRRCAPTRTSVPATPAGLPRPPYEYTKTVNCEGATRVYVRVRATLAAPAPWRRLNAEYTGAEGRVVSGSIAVRDHRGRPLAFAQLRGERATVWLADRCY